MIPAFAFAYDLAAGSFYQTSSMHEPSYLDNQFHVAQAIAQGAARGVSEQAYRNKCKTCQSLAYPDAVDLSASASNLLVTIGFAAQDGTDVTIQVDIPTDNLPSLYDTAGGFVPLPYSVIPTANTLAGEASSGGLQLFEQYTNAHLNPDMPITPAELNKIQQVSDAAKGTVSGLPDQFVRMLYFSAVSATTLGFGDIVPVTTVSRLLVTLEAIFGVVFVGLFLNSLAQRGPGTRKVALGTDSAPEHPRGTGI
jgi:hypothetical protein